MNRALNGPYGERLKVHGHATLTTDPAGGPLPDPGLYEGDIRRVVLRPKGDITFTLDGTDPTGAAAMYALKDEVITLDTDRASIRVAGSGVEVKLVYLGA